MKSISVSLLLSAVVFSSSLFAVPVNINTASATKIASSLKGIGMAKAQAIVAYRKEHGAFKMAKDLTNVKGVGSATLKSNQADILLK